MDLSYKSETYMTAMLEKNTNQRRPSKTLIRKMSLVQRTKTTVIWMELVPQILPQATYLVEMWKKLQHLGHHSLIKMPRKEILREGKRQIDKELAEIACWPPIRERIRQREHCLKDWNIVKCLHRRIRQHKESLEKWESLDALLDDSGMIRSWNIEEDKENFNFQSQIQICIDVKEYRNYHEWFMKGPEGLL